MIALLLAAGAAGHIYLAQGKLLFLLPASESACAITSLRYGPPSGKWERGVNPPIGDCKFRQSVEPGGLLPAWADAGKDNDELEVAYQVKGDKKFLDVKLVPEKLETAATPKFSAKATKVKDSVKVELKNEGPGAVLIGDAVAARSKPADDCVGNGATVALQPGETLADVRPGLVSQSMKVYAAVFSGEKACKWVEVKR
jgi:hypothetical protein